MAIDGAVEPAEAVSVCVAAGAVIDGHRPAEARICSRGVELRRPLAADGAACARG